MQSTQINLPLPQLKAVELDGGHGPLRALIDEPLRKQVRTVIAFTGRSGGVSVAPYDSLNLGDHVADDPASVRENRMTLMRSLDVPAGCHDRLIVPNQVHGSFVLEVGDNLSAAASTAHGGADGIVCAQSGAPVLLCFADCVPVILVAPGGAFAVAHAGWRGAIADIPAKALLRLCDAAGCSPDDCNAYIGPHIGSCCYETSQEILERFVSEFGDGCDCGNRLLDLSFAVEASLLRAGASERRIVDAKACTHCNERFYFSYRASGGTTGRHGAFAYKE